MNIMIYKTKLTLYESNFDCNNNIKPNEILNIFQNVSSAHSDKLHIGQTKLLSQNLCWVLSKVKYDIIKQPKINEKIKIETWPNEKDKFIFTRNYIVKNNKNEILIKGCSHWSLINFSTRKLQNSQNINYPKKCLTKTVYNEKLSKTPLIENKTTPIYKHKIDYLEIDHNNHFNNANYAKHICNALKQNFNHLQINFVSECLLNDDLQIFNESYNHQQIIAGYVNNVLKFTALIK